MNFAFYTVAFFVILTVTGVDTNAMFIGLSGLLVSFAFMIGSASSKYVVRSFLDCTLYIFCGIGLTNHTVLSGGYTIYFC